MAAWPVEPSQLKFKKRLGQGAFGEVWLCIWNGQQGQQEVAVKRVPLAPVKQSGMLEQLRRELKIMRTLKHPHIVECLFDFRDSKHLFLGMELAQVAMYDKLSKVGKFSLQRSAQYFWQLCDALVYLHGLSPCVIHRDIKPENVLIDKEGRAKLCDFGWSAMMNQGLRGTFCGTPEYLAPEMIRNEGHDEKVDIWCMGVLLFEIAVGRSPFSSNSQEETCRRILLLDFNFPANTEPQLKELVLKLCQLPPRERPTADEAKRDPFVKARYAPVGEVDEAMDALQKQVQLSEELGRLRDAAQQSELQLAEAKQELVRTKERLNRERQAKVDAAQERVRLEAVAARQLRELERFQPAARVQHGG